MLELKNISKYYANNGKKIEAIKNISLKAGNKKIIALVGPSGCGKTTLLKIIAGLLPSSSGEVILNGKIITEPNKKIGMIFQNFSLFPWLTVKENIAFGLNLQKISNEEKEKLVQYYLSIINLKDFANAYPKNISGGMQQRVAIARTLVNNPSLILMDEPFSSLDAQTRFDMQEFLLQLWENEKVTIIFVTHDVEEAIFLADEIIVLTARPAEIKNAFVIPFGKSRDMKIKYSHEFSGLKKAISKELKFVNT